jgi:nucleoside-diphosphate-sugar epimerase
VYASSSCVYSDGASLPFSEDAPLSLQFETPYEITKTLGEAYCDYFHGSDLSTVRARIFNVYGPGEVPGRYRNVIPKFVYYAKTGRELPITGSGDETRDFTYVGDIADGLLAPRTGGRRRGEAFNHEVTGAETRI